MVSLRRLEISELCRLNLVFKLGYDDVYLQIYCYFLAPKMCDIRRNSTVKSSERLRSIHQNLKFLDIANAKDIDVPDAFIAKPQLLTWLFHQ